MMKWKQPNLNALAAFQQRKIEGMNLSTRVWNLREQLRQELELALDLGLAEGKSATRLSRDVRRYLNNPDKLFRRVRDKHGNLRLSKAAKAYHPGRGVYRSSYKNALRLTATENNMAYRTADHLRWQQMPFVIGIEVKLSNNHTCKGVVGRFVDICDNLAGTYPKDFKFVGWHPHCRCFAVAKLADRKDIDEYRRREDNGEDVSDFHFNGEVKTLPRNFKDWYTDNTDRIARAKSQPYFLRDNAKLIEKNVRTMNRMAMESGRLIEFADMSQIEQNRVKSEIHTLANKLEIFPKNVNVTFSSNLDNSTLMVWEGHGITISCGKFAMDNGTNFCPALDLSNALKKLRGELKGDLTFNEEYAIEALFHESVHSRMKKEASITLQNNILEICTQLYARNNYPKIIKHYGKLPKHFEAIQTSGYGYKDGCNLLRKFFTKDGELQVGELINVANGTEDGIQKLNKLFEKFNVARKEKTKIFEKLM